MKADWRSCLAAVALSDILAIQLAAPSIQDFDPHPCRPAVAPGQHPNQVAWFNGGEEGSGNNNIVIVCVCPCPCVCGVWELNYNYNMEAFKGIFEMKLKCFLLLFLIDQTSWLWTRD